MPLQYRLKQNAKCADQAAEKQALKRLNTEAADETKVLGKHKVDFDRDDVVEEDVVMDDV